MKLRIGTRKSRLAMVQTEMVKQKLEECFPDLEIEVIPMSTKGDKIEAIGPAENASPISNDIS